ncbi:MAG: penicillin-insensitive murein endopeptidase [Myxococcota bacterium]
MSRWLVLVGAAMLQAGCVGVPSPLAPGLEGSVGVPHFGSQTAAVQLPVAGKGFVRYRPHGHNYWGLPRLVKLVSEAAAHVARVAPDGAPLLVGDLSARYGGKIPGHNSHRSGRDVDLLLFVTTPAGVPRESPGFVAIDGDGLGFVEGTSEYVRLDVEREWLLIKHLVSAPDASVQFLFLSQKLEALLIDYALARGEPLEVIHRAQTVLMQPTDSTPHDDHIHLRLACAPSEAVSGCSGGGPHWEWFPESDRAPELDAAELARIAEDDPLQGSVSAKNEVDGVPGGV